MMMRMVMVMMMMMTRTMMPSDDMDDGARHSRRVRASLRASIATDYNPNLLKHRSSLQPCVATD
jgi:hypothetical protein